MYFQPEIETMDRAALRDLQLTRLKASLKHCYEHVPHFHKKFDEIGFKPEDLTCLEDLSKLPFLMKSDLRDNYPFGMFAVPRDQIVRYQGSSGTTGKPTLVAYTRNDLNTWSDCVARLAYSAGARPGDIAQISFGYGLFTGAFGLHQGLEKIGVGVIPMSSGNTEKQLMMLEDMQVNLLIATPSYAVYLSELAKQKGVSDKLKLRVGLFGGEGCTAEMRAKIEENFGIMATDNYGMSELIGPGVAGECPERKGLHIAEDHFIAEIIDPETGEVLPEGAEGELVITSLTKEAFPIVRYRTRDITRLNYEKCACGRTHVRMDRVRGRTDDMMVIKGVNVFPSQVESVILGMDKIGLQYLLVVRSQGYMNTLEVKVELKDDSLLESYSELEKLTNEIRNKLRTVLGLDAKVTLVAPGTIERTEGKAKRVVDLRDKTKNVF